MNLGIIIKQIVITLIFLFIFSTQSLASINAIWPLPNHHSIVTSHCQQNSYGVHNGIDIAGQKDLNLPVKAICDGTVIYNHTDRNDIWNAFLIVKHNCDGHTVYGYYGHLNPNNISNTVKKNQTIATLRNWVTPNGYDNTHLHFSASSSLQTNHWGYRECGTGSFVDPLTYFSFDKSQDISVFDFRRRADPIIASNRNGQENFDAQFKINNNNDSSVEINNMAIAIIKDGNFLFDCWKKDSPTYIEPNSTYETGIHYCEIYNSGNYSVEARLNIDGTWHTYGSPLRFRVLPPSNSILEKSNIVFDFIEDNYSQWFPPRQNTVTYSVSGTDSYYRYYPSTDSWLFSWIDGNLWYNINDSEWQNAGSIEEWYNDVTR